MHNSVKLRSALPDRDALPLTSSWAGTADRNVEFSRIERSKFEKSSKNYACVLDVAKTATLMASACSNSPGAQVSGR